MDAQEHITQLLAVLPELAAAEIPIDDAQAHARLCTEVSKVIAGLQHFRSRVLAAGARAEVPQRLGATSMGAVMAQRHGGDRREAEADTRRGEALDTLSVAGAAAGVGELTPRQAGLIAATLAQLPGHLSAERRHTCEEFLVGVAQRASLRGLRRACDRISAQWLETTREVDIAEGQILQRREEQARHKAAFAMTDQGDGTHKGWFVIPEAQAALLRTALEAISAPRRDHLNGFEDRPSYRHRLGQAFTALCDHLPVEALPQNGGMAARVVVTVSHASLISGQGVAELSTGTRLSASQARIIAANTGVIPAVLGAPSQVLDLGRSRRLFSEAQRVAMALRDGGCSFPGCDRPPGWCEAHHATAAWAEGGPTDLNNGTLLCWHHHRHVEQHDWRFQIAADGAVEWIPPASVDRTGRPRRHERRQRADLVLAT